MLGYAVDVLGERRHELRVAEGDVQEGRILQALAAARSPEPAEPWQRQTWQLAGAALRRAESLGWNLLENPQRLRVRTIDSLCQYLARQMPLSSGFGEPPKRRQRCAPPSWTSRFWCSPTTTRK